MSKPLVSVIITLYNYQQYVKECIKSVALQTFQDFEVIIVDDCSTDNSANIAEAAMDKHGLNGWVMRLDENLGYSVAKNTGIKKAQGKYIATLDADDIFTVKSLEVRVRHLEADPKLDFVHGVAMRWYGGLDTRGYNKKTYVHAQGRMYKRELHEKFGLYHAMRSMSDKEFVYRIGVHPDSPLPKLVKELKIGDVVAWYRKHDLAMHKVRRDSPKYNEQIKMVFKKRIKHLRKNGITENNTEFL